MSSIRDSLTPRVALLAACVALLAACKEKPAPAPAADTPPTPPSTPPPDAPPAPPAADAAPAEPPRQPVNAEDFGRVVGGVVAVNIHYTWGYAHVDGRWIVAPRARAAADMTAERGWLTLEDALELVDVNGTQLALLPGAKLVEVHPDGGATIERAGKKERIGRDGALVAEPPPVAAEAPAVTEAPPAPTEPPPAAAAAPPAAVEAPPAAEAIDAGDVLAAFSHVSEFVGNLGWGIKDGDIHCLRRDRKKGIIARRIKVDGVSEVHPGWLIVNREKHLYSPCGYVNARCRMIIAPDDLAVCQPFDKKTGLAYVQRLTKYRCFAGGYREECVDMFATALIDTDGNLVTSEYSELEPLENGLWRAAALWRSPEGERWMRWGLIDPAAAGDAQELVSPQYESIADRGEGWFIVKEFDGRHQLIQPGGRVLSLPPLAQ